MRSIFIVGYWNSGTTLLTDILRKHPEIKLKRARFKPNLEERTTRKILRKMGTDYYKLDYPEIIKNGFQNYTEPRFNEEQKRIFRKKFNWHFGVSDKHILLLKNPFLFFFKDFIQDNFAQDDLKKIIILRGACSQVVSKGYWQRNTDDPEEKLRQRTGFWLRAMEYYFEHWYQDPTTLTLRYENLCAQPYATVQEVCRFLHIPFDAFSQHIPQQLSNRTERWDNLPEKLKKQVQHISQDMQSRIDTAFPIISP